MQLLGFFLFFFLSDSSFLALKKASLTFNFSAILNILNLIKMIRGTPTPVRSNLIALYSVIKEEIVLVNKETY